MSGVIQISVDDNDPVFAINIDHTIVKAGTEDDETLVIKECSSIKDEQPMETESENTCVQQPDTSFGSFVDETVESDGGNAEEASKDTDTKPEETSDVDPTVVSDQIRCKRIRCSIAHDTLLSITCLKYCLPLVLSTMSSDSTIWLNFIQVIAVLKWDGPTVK